MDDEDMGSVIVTGTENCRPSGPNSDTGPAAIAPRLVEAVTTASAAYALTEIVTDPPNAAAAAASAPGGMDTAGPFGTEMVEVVVLLREMLTAC